MKLLKYLRLKNYSNAENFAYFYKRSVRYKVPIVKKL